MAKSIDEVAAELRKEIAENSVSPEVMDRIQTMHYNVNQRLHEQIELAEQENTALPLDLWDVLFAINGVETYQTITDFYNQKCINERDTRALGPWSDILEVGCGSGKWVINLCRSYKCRGWGIDIDPRVVEKATRLRDVVDVIERNDRPPLKLIFRKANAFKLPYRENRFQIAFSEGVIEHPTRDSPQRLKILEEMARVASDAVLVVTNDAEGPKTQEKAARNVYDYETMPEKETPYTKIELEENLNKVGLKDISVAKFTDSNQIQEYLLAVAFKS